QGSTTEKTLNSRMRRAMSWVYCDPKSRITIVEVCTEAIVNAGLLHQRANGDDEDQDAGPDVDHLRQVDEIAAVGHASGDQQAGHEFSEGHGAKPLPCRLARQRVRRGVPNWGPYGGWTARRVRFPCR